MTAKNNPYSPLISEGSSGSSVYDIGSLNVSGRATVESLRVTDSTTSTSSTTGAVVVTGGVGIVENLRVGGTLGVTGAATLSSTLAVTGAATFAAAIYGASTARFTTSVQTPLVVGGTATSSSLIFKQSTGTSGAGIIFQVGNNGATNAMTILNSGYVGIGTTAPGYKCEVTGDIASVNGNAFNKLWLGGTDYSWSIGRDNTDSGQLKITYESGASVKACIDRAGYVGIGTTAPGCALCVNGGVSIGDDTNAGDNNLYVVGDVSALTFTDRV